MFQNLNGAPLLDQLIGPTVQLVFDKLAQPDRRMTQTLKRHLILTLLSCTLHNPLKTLDEIFARGGSDELTNFFKEIVEAKSCSGSCSHKKLRSPYEIKVYAVALTNIIFKAVADN